MRRRRNVPILLTHALLLITFLRATTFASMFTPGPFETRAKEAMYNVTLPEASWPEERVEEFMQGRSRPTRGRAAGW